MTISRVEYFFLKRSIEQFSEDLHKLQNLITNKVMSEEEVLNLMLQLVAIKENIAGLEKNFEMMNKK